MHPQVYVPQLAVALVSLLNLVSLQLSANEQLLRSISSQGIVVPKRTALIVGLNQQFKSKVNKISPAGLPPSSIANGTSSQLQSDIPVKSPASHGMPFWLQARLLAQQRRATQQQQQNPHVNRALYFDRHQQELLAAAPNLLNPPNMNGLPTLTRSGSEQASSTYLAVAENATLKQQACLTSGQQQLYRGYSLIELDLKSESDRRYVQDLYSNLSLALNEQARNPSPLVSPYADIDFWSFKYALNDQIDIMVSPKSRAFVLGQLNRAKIRHRIKIDDIQSRLDQQMAPAASGAVQPPTKLPLMDSPLEGRQDSNPKGPNLQARQSVDSTPNKPFNESAFFENYQRLADINQYLEFIVEQNRDIAQVRVIGRSSQGRLLRVLQLGYPTGFISDTLQARDDSSLPNNTASNILDNFMRKQSSVGRLGTIWLDGGTHAREWITPATVLYLSFRLSDNHKRCSAFFDTLTNIVRQTREERSSRLIQEAQLNAQLLTGINEINTSLLGRPVKFNRPRTELEHTMELLAKSPQDVASEYGCDLSLDQLLRKYTFYIMPVLNPDGYEYSHTHNRLWRKTRSVSSHPVYRLFCLGVDPNRNYDARHGLTGSSSHPCSQTYAGATPFTEPETKHQSNFVYANRNNMKMYISFHSYSQVILLPFSHSKMQSPDHKDLESVGLAAAKAIEQTHGTQYRVGPSASLLYTASGTASDWAYEKAGVKYSYTIELRDTGNFGFLLPKQQIIPTGQETFNGFLAMVEQMEKNDNLLTSKSTVVGTATDDESALSSVDYNHVPDPDRFGPFQGHRSRPPLENILDGQTPAETGLMGVRDRRPIEGQLGARNESLSESGQHEGGEHELLSDNGHPDDEADSSYVYESDNDLMEPQGVSLGTVHKLGELFLGGRQGHSRRIAQVATMTATGRNSINSPPSISRTTSMVSRRESSENQPQLLI